MTLRHGYFSDQGYTFGAYPETSPERLAFVALLHSQRPPDLGSAFRVLELGCGQGFGLCLQAANYPQAQFTGVDFRAGHIAHGRALARSAELGNISFVDADFLSLAQAPPEGWGPFDLVIAHGIYGWVSPELGGCLMQLAAGSLRPGGLFYRSYNTLPGWLSGLPFQHAVKSYQSRLGDGQPSLDAARTLFQQLQDCGSPLFLAQPALAGRLEGLGVQPAAYLLHEYNHAQWQPQYADQVIRQAAELELLFLGSAMLPESFDGLLPEAFRSLLAGQTETDLHELARDLLTNQSFRRDVYTKGRDPLWNLYASEAIQRLEVISLIEANDLLRPDAFSFRLPFGEVQGNRAWFLKLMDHLQQGPCRLGDLHRVPLHGDGSTPLPELLQNVALLLHKGSIALQPPARDPEPAQRFNRVIAAHVAAGAPYAAIALPRTGNLMALSDLDLLLLHAWQRGCRGDALIEALNANLQSLGRSIQKEGHPLEDGERLELLTAHGSRFEAKTLPLLQRLEAVAVGD
jgi:SAM-dependent methyltransferase